MKHPLLTLFCLGIVAGFGLLQAAVIWAQGSGRGLAIQKLGGHDELPTYDS